MKKKILIIVAVFLFLVVFGSFFIPKKQKESPLNVLSTTPKNNAQFVNEKSEVIITLNRNLTQEEGNNLKVQIKPDEKTEIVYQENKIRISPEESFEMNTAYEIQVIFKEKTIYKLTFITTPFTQQQIEEEGSKQTAGDLAFTEAYKQFLIKYPWYTKLPIETFEYRIVYDFEKESFRIRLKIKPQGEEQEKNIVNKALKDLEKIGVRKPINYYVLRSEE